MPTSSNPTSTPSEPNFSAPWEAEAFALRAHLVRTGRLDAAAFSACLGEEMAAGHAARDGGTAYFVAFVRALERALAADVPAGALASEQGAWRAAAAATPHGAPIDVTGFRRK
ncbi:MAG: nitrile hydratase accessory protein [Pseudomonadota bacterium]